MRRVSGLLMLGVGALVACSRPAQPPAGRWIGNYDSPAVMVDARLEIGRDGQVRASAPDLLDIGQVTDEERTAMHARLADDLAQNWDEAEPKAMDFDGRIFRKPGGVAPQMEWDPHAKVMKLIFYFGTMHSIRIAMHAVGDFAADPWAR